MNVLMQQLDEYRRNEDGSVIQGAAHTSKLLNHKYRNRIIMTTYSYLKKLNIDYDAIACCGTSGLMIVPQIAELLTKNIIVVRKDLKGYSKFYVEGPYTKKYIIIDDLICSGDTIKHILTSINRESSRSKCMGVYSYIKDECAYRNHPEYCKKDLNIEYL